jgi:hypothetical protein
VWKKGGTGVTPSLSARGRAAPGLDFEQEAAEKFFSVLSGFLLFK